MCNTFEKWNSVGFNTVEIVRRKKSIVQDVDRGNYRYYFSSAYLFFSSNLFVFLCEKLRLQFWIPRIVVVVSTRATQEKQKKIPKSLASCGPVNATLISYTHGMEEVFELSMNRQHIFLRTLDRHFSVPKYVKTPFLSQGWETILR